MLPIQTPITGQELKTGRSLPYDALVDFYAAFNKKDMDLMARNWAQTDDVSMDNPLGGIKRGWNEIQEVYANIFNGPADVQVEFHDYTLHEAGGMFLAVGRERGLCHVGGEDILLAIRTSRTYQFVDGRWQQVHHHGSIDDAALLRTYQAAVFRK
ncbi:nuclear transport factor 2 family protein [Alicyclobacillus curvatus]|nr:nuclear transport factor 2 family protein [Alicyclobacillus curvatus]